MHPVPEAQPRPKPGASFVDSTAWARARLRKGVFESGIAIQQPLGCEQGRAGVALAGVSLPKEVSNEAYSSSHNHGARRRIASLRSLRTYFNRAAGRERERLERSNGVH